MRRRLRIPALLLVALVGVPALLALGGTEPGRAGAPERVAPSVNADVPQRIAYAGTDHRSIGLIRGDGTGAVADPFFGTGPDHFDDQVSARGSVATWVSRRDATTSEVYLRRGDGPAVRVTDNSADETRPVLSPDGTRIAYSSGAGRNDGGCDIFVIGVDGTGERRVTDGNGDNRWPTWSPDGNVLAFEGRRGGNQVTQVYRVPAGGGTIEQVTAEQTGAREPAWDPNPEHNRIAYTTEPADGSGPRIRMTAPDGYGTTPAELLLPNWQSSQAAWTADGATVAFISRTPPDGGSAGTVDLVYSVVVQADPCSCQVILRLDQDRDSSHPAWYQAPGTTGESLLVARSSAPDRNVALLQDIRPDGIDPRSLRFEVLREDPKARVDNNFLFVPTDGDPWFERQAYSPDGRTIAVTKFETLDGVRTEQIWIVNADGGDPHPLPIDERQPGDWETDPAWSPDGTRLALTRNSPRTGGNGQPERTEGRIEVVEVATGAQVLALPTPPELAGYDDTQPAWSPDGTRLAFTRGDNRTRQLTHIWTARASDGLDQTDLTAAVCGYACTVFDDSAAFSPDGTQIAFNRELDGVLLASPNGTNCRALLPPAGATCAAPVPTQPAGQHQPRDVTWSPDGKQLAFSSRREANFNSPEALSVYDFADGSIRPLTWNLPGRQKEPTWQRSVDVSTSVARPADPTTVGGRTNLRIGITDQGPSAAPAIRLTLTVPPQLSVTGLTPPQGTCSLADLTCDLGTIGVGSTVEVVVDLVGTAVGTFTVSWSVDPGPTDADPSDNQRQTTVRVTPAPPGSPPDPAVSVSVNPAPGYVGGTVTVTYTVRNAGGTAATGLRVRPNLPAGVPATPPQGGCAADTGCPVKDLAPGAAATVTFSLRPAAALSTTVRGTVTTTGGNASTTNDTASTPLRILQPRIVAVPPIGPPGFVTLIRGVDFPPARPVRLSWNTGITAAAAPVVPARNGSFTAQLLVLPKDQIGPRLAVATGTGFSPVDTPFLVILPAQQPPGLLERGW